MQHTYENMWSSCFVLMNFRELLQTVDDGDIVEMSLWHEDHRSSSSSNANTRCVQF